MITHLKNKINGKMHDYFMTRAIKKIAVDLKKQASEHDKNLKDLLLNINKIIIDIYNEVEVFMKGLDVIEAKYGKIAEAEKDATLFSYIDLSYLDIIILHKQYLLTNDSIERNFICRTAAHHMYEFLEDGSKVFGKELGSTINRLKQQDLNNKLKNLRISFNELRTNLHEPLKSIRHNVSGHKDRSLRNQLSISKSIQLVDFQLNFLLFMLFYINFCKLKNEVREEMLKRMKTTIE